VLERILSKRATQFSSCLESCSLALACCGCLSGDCTMARDLFAVSLGSVYESLSCASQP
jgi:hypothetical protein